MNLLGLFGFHVCKWGWPRQGIDETGRRGHYKVCTLCGKEKEYNGPLASFDERQLAQTEVLRAALAGEVK